MFFIFERCSSNGQVHAVLLDNLRRLLTERIGATSFDDLRTVNGRLCTSYKEACVELGFTASDRECELAMQEACQMTTGFAVRQLFVTILLECSPVSPLALWESYKDGWEKRFLNFV